MQLLTVGRSLSEAKDCPHRYKLRTDPWPTFGNAPGRARRSGRGESAVGEAEAAETSMNTETAGERNAAVRQAYPKGRWTLATNPFSTTRRVPAAPGAPAPAQGELSLDKVRPVRNDLSDTDLELIPAKRVEKNIFAAPAAASTEPASPVKSKVSLWKRLAARFRRGAKK
jgi:hypothetical protein